MFPIKRKRIIVLFLLQTASHPLTDLCDTYDVGDSAKILQSPAQDCQLSAELCCCFGFSSTQFDIQHGFPNALNPLSLSHSSPRLLAFHSDLVGSAGLQEKNWKASLCNNINSFQVGTFRVRVLEFILFIYTILLIGRTTQYQVFHLLCEFRFVWLTLFSYFSYNIYFPQLDKLCKENVQNVSQS